MLVVGSPSGNVANTSIFTKWAAMKEQWCSASFKEAGPSLRTNTESGCGGTCWWGQCFGGQGRNSGSSRPAWATKQGLGFCLGNVTNKQQKWRVNEKDGEFEACLGNTVKLCACACTHRAKLLPLLDTPTRQVRMGNKNQALIFALISISKDFILSLAFLAIERYTLFLQPEAQR